MSETVEVEKEFLQRIVAVLDSRELGALCVLGHIHGAPYKGPTIDMPRLRALAGVDGPPDEIEC